MSGTSRRFGIWLLALALGLPAWAAAQDPPSRPGGGGGGESRPTPTQDTPPSAPVREVAVPRGDGGGPMGRIGGGIGSMSGGGMLDAGPRAVGAPPSPAPWTERAASGDRPRAGRRDDEPMPDQARPRREGAPPYSRPRDDRPVTGRAVPRGEAPVRDVRIYTIPYFGYGYGSPYWYSPYGYGGFGLGYFYYDPWGWGYPSGYWAGYGYGPAYYGGYGRAYAQGAVRLKVKPVDAEVLVDGYFVGRVDEFDGVFQRLNLDYGPHRIEIRAPGFEPLTFEVRVQPGRTITYQGELKPIQ